ncbi:MAG: hypothetical protein HQK83_04150 [Fibrobacteria bacterium]|nr:hypothetical protein [Fibrobacteria bacterium]
MKCKYLFLAVVVFIVPAISFSLPPEWEVLNKVVKGAQFDAIAGPDGKIHLIAEKYVQIDSSGSVVLSEDVGDGQMSAMDFPPAIATAPDSTVHILTRHNGDWGSGHDLKYRRRNADGEWDREHPVGVKVARNYTVGLAAISADKAYAIHGDYDGHPSDVRFWEVSGGSSSELGTLSGVTRADNHSRLRAFQNTIFFVCGNNDDPGVSHYSWGESGQSFFNQIESNIKQHTPGSGRRGFPDVYPDKQGNAHFISGAVQELYYNQYDLTGNKKFSNDKKVMNSMGTWHLSVGLSAIASTDNGEVILVIGLGTNGSKTASNSDILWSVSEDSGATWSPQKTLGPKTEGGEGRLIPRLAVLNNKFFLFYYDTQKEGVYLATLDYSPEVVSINYKNAFSSRQKLETQNRQLIGISPDYTRRHGRINLLGQHEMRGTGVYLLENTGIGE